MKKTTEEIEIMKKGGEMLGEIRDKLAKSARGGMKTSELDDMAYDLIKKTGGKPSFMMVDGYKHSTCINVNEEVVHGVPGKRIIREGDLVGIDVGLFWEGFHTDTATSVVVGGGSKYNEFISAGKNALVKAIEQARVGNKIYDLSLAMQTTIESHGFNVVRALTGHGVGKNLHEEPSIPCFVSGTRKKSREIEAGMTLAIEIMYNMGTGEVVYGREDGWTIVSEDGKISGLFEETVAVYPSGPVVLTRPYLL